MKMTITRRARHALKTAYRKVNVIARQHLDVSESRQGLGRTQHRLKTGHVLWTISFYPHDHIFLDNRANYSGGAGQQVRDRTPKPWLVQMPAKNQAVRRTRVRLLIPGLLGILFAPEETRAGMGQD